MRRILLLTWVLTCSLIGQLLPAEGQTRSKAYPWREAASILASHVTCPAGPYVSDVDRKKRESYLATWLPPNVHPIRPISNYEDGIKWLNPQCTRTVNLSQIRGKQLKLNTDMCV